jgi:hypothetical protein
MEWHSVRHFPYRLHCGKDEWQLSDASLWGVFMRYSSISAQVALATTRLDFSTKNSSKRLPIEIGTSLTHRSHHNKKNVD